MEGCLNEISRAVDKCLAAALYDAEHYVRTYASVEVGLAMDAVAEVVPVGGMLVEVTQSPSAADDCLYAEDVALLAVYFALHHAGDVCLELYVADKEEFVSSHRSYF